MRRTKHRVHPVRRALAAVFDWVGFYATDLSLRLNPLRLVEDEKWFVAAYPHLDDSGVPREPGPYDFLRQLDDAIERAERERWGREGDR